MAYSSASRPDAVEHVSSEGDGDNEVFWVALVELDDTDGQGNKGIVQHP